MKYDYNGVFISMQTIITLHFLRFAKSMSKWYTHVNAFYQYVLPVIDDKQGISNLLSKLSNVLSRFWRSSWYSFQKIHIPNHRFWQHIRKDMYANEYPWTKVTKNWTRNYVRTQSKRVTHFLYVEKCKYFFIVLKLNALYQNY